jgi:o-succinylbenzoate---CoA ligase
MKRVDPFKEIPLHPLKWRARLTPNSTAVVSQEKCLTWSELDELVDTYGQNFNNYLDHTHQRGALFATTNLDSLLTLLAFWNRGISATLLNPRLLKQSSIDQIQTTKAQFLCVPEGRSKQFSDFPVPVLELKKNGTLTYSKTFPSPVDEACILYTSGSSGQPKGVVLSFRNLIASALQSNEVTGLIDTSKWLLGLPLCHAAGLMIVVRSIMAGSTLVLKESTGLKAVVESVKNREVTHLSLLPEMMADIVKNHSDLVPELQQMSAIILGGSPPAKELLQKLRELKLPIFLSYGMTETASHVCLARQNDPIGSVGKPLAFSRIEVRKKEGGRIAVGGDVLFSGYVTPTGEFVRHDAEWFLTQDYGSIDEEGYLYVHGRIDDIMISGGEKINPHEIVAAALSHPEVVDAIVTKIPHATWGERPKLWVCTHDVSSFDMKGLNELLSNNLSRLVCPDEVVVLAEFPRTILGKIDKQALSTKK